MNKTKTMMTGKEYAAHRGVTPSAVTKWKSKKLLFVKAGRIDVAASDAVLDAMESGFEDGREPKNFNEAQFMKELYLAKIRRLEYLEKAGDSVALSQLRDTLQGVFSQHRDGLLTIPERLSAPLALENNSEKVREILYAEITGHLNGLADQLEGK